MNARQLDQTEVARHWAIDCDIHEVPDLMKLKIHPGGADSWSHTMESIRKEEKGTHYSASRFHLGRHKSMADLDAQFDYGWAEGAERALALSDSLMDKVAQPRSIRRRIRWADDGDEFEKERLIDGHFDACWRTTKRQVAVATPVINIVCSWGGNGGRSHDQLFWSGAAAMALVRVLENSGYQTSLTAIAAGNMHTGGWADEADWVSTSVRVKQSGEYLRADAVASLLADAAAFRTYVFRAYTSPPWGATSGLGRHRAASVVVPDLVMNGVIHEPQIILPDCYDESTAKQALTNALRDLAAANLAALPEGVEL